MIQHVRSGFFKLLRNRYCTLLAFCWVSGFVAGLWFYIHNQSTLSSLMRRIVFSPVSIVGFLFAFLLPFLFSAFAVYFHTPVWIFPISVYKAFLFASVSIGVIDCLGSAGWLFRLLLLTGDVLIMPALYLYWLRGLLNASSVRLKSMFLLTIAVFLLGCVNNRFLLQVLTEFGNR